MGFLRTYLALLVVFGHLVTFDRDLTTPLAGGAILAVKFFFVLSGFYMSMVLDTKYGLRTYDFYKSRALRLFPLYWATCLVVVVLVLAVGDVSYYAAAKALRNVPSPQLVWMQGWTVFSNITLFGSDLLNFAYCCGTNGTQLDFFPEVEPDGSHKLASHLVLQQSWTLGIEMVFYLVVPFLFRKAWSGILLLLAISVTSRMLVFGIGLHGDNWSRQFVLSEAVYFALGMASYRLYKNIPARLFTKGNKWLAAALVLSWTTIQACIYIKGVNLGDRQIWETFYHWGFMAIMVVSVPFLFELSKGSRADFFAGELSYPIYITHYPTIVFLLPVFRGALAGWSFSGKLLFCLGAVIVVALLGIALVAYPIEYLRGRGTMRARYAPIRPA